MHLAAAVSVPTLAPANWPICLPRALASASLKQLPPGIIQTTVGDAEAMGELFSSFALAMATGVLCIYIVLVLLFKDFVQPVTILAALVLSVPGAFLALFVAQKALRQIEVIAELIKP